MVSSDAAWRAVRQRICRSISVYLHGGYLGSCPLSRIFLGTIVTLMEPPFLSSRIGLTISAPVLWYSRYFQGATGASLLLVLLSRIGLAISVPVLPISDAVHCNRSRSALQPSPQCTASVLAMHCLFSPQTFASFPVNVCILSRKRLQPPS